MGSKRFEEYSNLKMFVHELSFEGLLLGLFVWQALCRWRLCRKRLCRRGLGGDRLGGDRRTWWRLGKWILEWARNPLQFGFR
jgi:hypothetical protein